MAEKLPESLLGLNRANIEARESMMVSVLNRRRYVWYILCESDENSTQSSTFYNTLNNMRYYFYSALKQTQFWSIDSSHHSEESDKKIGTHNDYHVEGQFHIHMDGMLPIEASSQRIQVFQSLVLCYFLFNSLLFISFAVRKPRISNSRSEQRTQTIKLFGFYLILLIAVLFGEIYCFALTYQTILFNRHWLEQLNNLKEPYLCTQPSLWIDIKWISAHENTSALNQLMTV